MEKKRKMHFTTTLLIKPDQYIGNCKSARADMITRKNCMDINNYLRLADNSVAA